MFLVPAELKDELFSFLKTMGAKLTIREVSIKGEIARAYYRDSLLVVKEVSDETLEVIHSNGNVKEELRRFWQQYAVTLMEEQEDE